MQDDFFSQNPFYYCTLDSISLPVEVLFFSDLYEKRRAMISGGTMVLMRGRVSTKEDEVKIIAQDITSLSEVRRAVPTTVHINLSTVGLEDTAVEQLTDILGSDPGQCAVCLHLDTLHDGRITVKSKRFKVAPTSETIERMRSLFGKDGVWLDREPDHCETDLQRQETPF